MAVGDRAVLGYNSIVCEPAQLGAGRERTSPRPFAPPRPLAPRLFAIGQGMQNEANMGYLLFWGQRLIAVPQTLALVVTLDVAAYFAGLLFWYGPVMSDPSTPWWAWPFIPDCPLFGLLGGLGLLMVVAQTSSHHAPRTPAALWIAVALAAAVWLTTLLPMSSGAWRGQAGMFALLSIALAVSAWVWRTPPVWLLGLFAFGQIKYGVWTITAWLLYWRSTAQLLGAPHFSMESLSMTAAHIGLAAQGILLLAYFRPTRGAALVSLVWFGLSDFMDYGLGCYPAIPEQLISLAVMQWSTISVTVGLTLLYWWLAAGAVAWVGMARRTTAA